MKKILKTLTTLIVLVVLCVSFSETAYALGEYTPLAPLPGTQITGNAAGQTNLETYIPAIFRLSIGIAAVMAFVAITFGGIMYATADALANKSQGREIVTNAIVGLLLVLGAWIILYTINPKILRFDLSISDITYTNSSATPIVGSRVMTAAEIADDATVRSQLAGISVNNGPCLLGQTRGCTNLNGLPPGAIQALKTLDVDCGCSLMITGGTEGGHATHGPGLGIVDLAPSPELNKYLGHSAPKDGTVVIKALSSGRVAAYTYETAGGNPNGTSTGNHWHVVLK